MFGKRICLDGDYKGFRDAGITYQFRFCKDGSYFYAAEQRGRWRLAHRGVFDMKQHSIPRPKGAAFPGSDTFLVVRFEPKFMDLVPPDPMPLAMLEERALPTNRIEEYKVFSTSRQNPHNPNLHSEQLTFSIPDPDGSSFSVSWHLDKIA